MALKEPLNAPGQERMAAAPLADNFTYAGLLVKQTPRGWLQELFGCQARTEYKMSRLDDNFEAVLQGGWITEAEQKYTDQLYSLEESNACMRICLREGRPMVVKLSTGSEEGGSPLVEYHKPCGLRGGFCCMLPEFTTKLPNGTEINAMKLKFKCCTPVPEFAYEEPVGKEVYRVHPPKCCGGCCIKIECGKGKCGTLPFYFWDPATGEQIFNEAGEEFPPQIRMLRTGLAKAACTQANNFALKFPKDATAEQKAGLLGLTFLIDSSFFERQKDDNK